MPLRKERPSLPRHPDSLYLTFSDVKGTLVGFWSPTFAGSFSVPGYHFHFISDDRKMGGHVLDCEAEHMTIRTCSMPEVHVSLPETKEFLQADLTRDPQQGPRKRGTQSFELVTAFDKR